MFKVLDIVMQVIFNISENEVNHELFDVIKTLLSRNAEIVIRKEAIQLEEFNQDMPLEQVMQALSNENYSGDFLSDIALDLKTSSVYVK